MGQIGNLLDRPKFYYNIDGVGELGMGLGCLGWVALIWLQIHTPSDSVWHKMYAFFIFVALMCSIIHYGSKAIKKHITYPRTGFVEYQVRKTFWIPMIIAFVVSALAVVGLMFAARSHWDAGTVASFICLLFAGCYAYGVARGVRWKWAVACAMVCGALVIPFLPSNLFGAVPDNPQQMALVLAIAQGAVLPSVALIGTLMLISGGISFRLYLRHTQPPEQEEP